MSDLHEQLYDYVESTIERVDIDDVAAAASAEPTARPKPTLRRPVWVAAGAALLVILLIGIPLLFIGNGDSTTADQTPPTVPTTTVAPPTTQPPSSDAGEETGTAAMVTPPIEATWTLEATVDGGWLTEPVAHNDGFLARHKALAEGAVEGVIHTEEGWGGQMWESTDGVTWVPTSDDQQWPPPPTDASATGSAVIVEYEGDRATERVGRLLATSDGSNWREINLRPYEDNWIPRVAEGGLGWLVYSPPRAEGASWSAPRLPNHGLWYTPDTEAWFEVANLGPLVNYADIGEVGLWDVAMIVRDDDILVFAYMAENLGFGNGSQHRTEIWQLEPGTARSTTGSDVVTETPLTTTTAAIPTTAAEAAPTTVAQPPGTWDPVLATTRAKVAPAAAGCPAGSNPNAPGPADQNRPQLAGYTSNQSSVFDEHAGRVIHVDDNGETWAFDVCTNTWTELNPTVDLQGLAVSPMLVEGELVYDVDSDATLYIRGGVVLVYDAAGNTWTAQQTPPTSYSIHYPGLGAVYDPVSGLVVVQTGDHGLVAYDVETNTWTEIGTPPGKGSYPAHLVGYSATTDRLYFLGNAAVTVDPRSGQIEHLDQPNVMGGWGAYEFATSTDTAYVYGMDGVCRLDPTSLNWTCTGTPDIPREIQNFESMVADPINNRLLLIHGSCCGVYPTMHDDVWALDFDTGEWILVLEEANQRVHQ